DGKRRKAPKLSKPLDPMLFLRKFLICPICGHCLTGATSSGNGGKYTYYFCCNDSKHIRVRAEVVNDAFIHYLSVLKPYKAVLDLYNEILKDIRMGDRKAQIRHTEALKEELNAIVKRMDSVQDKYIDGDIDKATYNRLMERYSHEAESVKQRIELAENKNSAKVEPKMGYAISLIDNIDRFILDAPVSLKIKLLGSMFPEKIEFDGKKYRTQNYNKVLDFIYRQTNELRCGKKENGESF
ncbi:MAG: recombinase family protein, partial [Bacteroidales bacterium]|nr:recombinase family protein [Bacteroidales bacterium]